MSMGGIKRSIVGSVFVLWGYLTLHCVSFLVFPLLTIFVIHPVAFRYIIDRFIAGPFHCALGVSCYCLLIVDMCGSPGITQIKLTYSFI